MHPPAFLEVVNILDVRHLFRVGTTRLAFASRFAIMACQASDSHIENPAFQIPRMIVKARPRKKKKRRGVFYTPTELSAALADWAIRRSTDRVLEPGFGGCGFLEAAANRLSTLGNGTAEKNIHGCDVDKMAFKHLSETFDSVPNGNFLKADFLALTPKRFSPQGFDVILSNPPYVSSHNSPAVAYLESLGSEVSKRVMISAFNSAACIINPQLSGTGAWRSVPWEKLTAPAVRAILARLPGSPASRNKMLSALKGITRAAWEMRMLDTEELMRIKSIKGDAGTREPAGRYVQTGEILALMRTCANDASPAGARDAAMIALAATTGARRAEIASVRLEAVTMPDESRIEIRVIGKRNKERFLYITGNARLALLDWMQIRIETGFKIGFLFCAIRKGGTLLAENGLSTTALDRILRKRSEEAGLADLDWHDLRRTTASNLLDAGADITTVAGILGHSNVQTTARYDRRGERARIKASELISVPYFQRQMTVGR